MRKQRCRSSPGFTGEFGLPPAYRLQHAEMDGLALSEKALKVSPDLRIVMVTGDPVELLYHKAAQAGIAAVLKKPFDIKDVVLAASGQPTTCPQPHHLPTVTQYPVRPTPLEPRVRIGQAFVRSPTLYHHAVRTLLTILPLQTVTRSRITRDGRLPASSQGLRPVRQST